jgi:hypothetical protein
MRVAAVLIVVLVCGCGSSPAEPLPVLSGRTLPDLEASTRELGPADLAADFGPQGDVEARLRDWGFVRGRERVFQGESRRFDQVVSRTLEFEQASGARAYVSFYGAHLTSVFGAGTRKSAIRSGGRTGYLVDAAACACHRAEPTLAAVVAGGARVTYLEVNGGGATREAVVDLLAKAP